MFAQPDVKIQDVEEQMWRVSESVQYIQDYVGDGDNDDDYNPAYTSGGERSHHCIEGQQR